MKAFTVLGLLLVSPLFAAQKQEPACEKYNAALKAAAATHKSGEYLANKSAVEAVIEVIDSDVDAKSASRKELSGIVAKLPKITGDDLTKLFFQTPYCAEVVQEYNALRRLLASAKPLKLDAKVQEKAKNATLGFINRRSENPGNLIEQAVQIALLENLNSLNYLKFDEAQSAKLSGMRAQIEQFKNQNREAQTKMPTAYSKEEFDKFPEEMRKSQIDAFAKELELTESLRKDLRGLVKTLAAS